MKKVLYFFPVNPLEKNEGNKVRALNLLSYFKTRRFTVDFVGQYDSGSDWSDSDIKSLNESGLVNSVNILSRKPSKRDFIKYFFSYKLPNLLYQVKLNIPKGAIPNYTTSYLFSCFNSILKKNEYDYIVISYASWADLIRNNVYLKDARTIIDTHDLISSQYQTDKRFIASAALGEEIRRLNLFDEIWAISSDERYFFSQFCSNTVRFIPMMVNIPNTDSNEKGYDVIYVASHNVHNKKSVKWFLEEVYPYLPLDLNICIVGRITESIDRGIYKNITLIPFAKDLDGLYAKSKIAICPMVSGTGIKVKVVEALSHGLPIVCTSRGIDGLPNKSNNGCLVSDKAETFASHLQLLLNNPNIYHKQSKLAKETFLDYFEIKQCYKELDIAFNI